MNSKGYALYEELAEVYDAIYQQIFDYEWEAETVERALNGKKTAKILDMGVGTGRLAEILAKKGYDVTGVDRSERMLQLAKRYAPDVSLLRADIRELQFKNEFDAVVCLGRVTTYMLTDQDLKRLFRSAYRALKEDGVFVVDAFDRKALAKNFETYSQRTEQYNTEFGRVVRTSRLEALGDGIFRWIAQYQVDGDTYEDTQRIRAFDREQFVKFLEDTGFHVERVDTAPPSIAPAFIVVAKAVK